MKKVISICLALVMVLSLMIVSAVSVGAIPKGDLDDEGHADKTEVTLVIRFVDSVTGTQLSPNNVIQNSFTIKSMLNGTVDASYSVTMSGNTVHVSDDILYFQIEATCGTTFEFDGYESSGKYYDREYHGSETVDDFLASQGYVYNNLQTSNRTCILTVTVSRECGDNVTYDFDDGTLTISGTGDMDDYTASDHSPFYDNDDIEDVVVENGVTSIGDYSFDECDNIESITVADSVNKVGENAFEDFTKPADIITTNPVVRSFFLAKGFAPSFRSGGLVNYNESEITRSGDTGASIVKLDYDTANFRVTVPTVLPYSVDADNNVTVADNAQISNLSNGPVDVTAVHANTVNGWAIVANGTDFRAVPVDSKQFTMTLNGDNFAAGTSVDLVLGSAWTTINGQANLALPYDGDFAIQSSEINAGQIANVIFTVAWHTAD